MKRQRFALIGAICGLAACGTPDAQQAVLGPSTYQASLGDTPPGAVACPITFPPFTTEYVSKALYSGILCGVSWKSGAWNRYQGNPAFFGYYDGGAFSPSTLNDRSFSSATITVTEITGAGRVLFKVKAGGSPDNPEWRILDSMTIPGPGTYTLRHPGIRTAEISEVPDDPNQIMTAWLLKLSFEPDCVTPGDPYANAVLESAEVRAGLADALKRSGIDSNPHLRVERGGWIYQRPDGSYFTVPYDDPNATSCTMELPAAPGRPDGIPAGRFHTHPHNQNDPVYRYDPVNEPLGCRKLKPGETGIARPLANGGGSEEDWGASVIGPPMYVITKAKNTMFFLDPSRGDRPTNPFKYKFDRSDPGACAPRAN